MTNQHCPKAALILIDSSEPTLIAEGIEEGWLVNLKAFRARGAWAVTGSQSHDINAACWPSFLTGRSPGDHGVWNYMAWDPAKMDHVPCDPSKQCFEPWWRALSDRGHRCVVLDIPRAYPPSRPFDGIELGAWAGHYKLTRPYSNPPAFLEQVRNRFSREPIGNEPGGDLTAPMLLKEYARVLGTTRLQVELAEWTLENEPCDLFLMALSGPHRAGHMLWDEAGLARPATAGQAKMLHDAIREAYIAADQAFGRIVAKLEAMGTPVILTGSLHGMGPNTSLALVLPKMLERVLNDRYDDDSAAYQGKPGLLKRARRAVPLSWRSAIKDKLPTAAQHWLTMFWRRESLDWSQTRAFTLMDDLQGFIRINLKGRERDGIVEPGAAYDTLCEQIMAGLQTFVHTDTGEPMVVEVYRSDVRFAGGSHLHEFPDLVVKWSDRPASGCRTFESPRYGKITWPTPGRAPDGRSGHHLHAGWISAIGPAVQAGAVWEGLHMFDLVPTLHRLVGAQVPVGVAGRVIQPLFKSGS